MQTDTLPLEKKRTDLLEIEACRDVIYFLTKYGKIREQNKGIIQWQPWKHLIQYLNVLRTHRFIIVLKAKQIGCTWTMALDNLHLALYKVGANILTLSKGQAEAAESLDYSRFFHSQLPDFMRIKIGKDNDSLLTFPSRHSRIRSLPATEDAGVGFGGATRVVMDEAEYHPFARKNYAEILPPILAGGQLVVQSTADRFKIDSFFKEMYIAARHGDNNFYPIFFPYDVLPGRTQEWYDSVTLPQKDKECRFPKTEEEALSTTASGMFFSKEALDIMESRTCPPIKHEMSDRFPTVRIYKPPIVGAKYYLATDPSDGDDPHCIIVADRYGEQVAESHGKTSIDACSVIHDALARMYGAHNTWESGPGGAGGVLTSKLEDMKTPLRCPPLNVSKRPFTLDYTKPNKGWWTSGALWKVGIRDLEEAVRTLQIVPRSMECIKEFRQFIQEEGKEDPEKVHGGHDDYIDAWLRLVMLKKVLPAGDMRVTSFKYK